MNDGPFYAVINTSGSRDSLIYLIVRAGDIGHYVVAQCYTASDARIMVDAFNKAEKAPPPF